MGQRFQGRDDFEAMIRILPEEEGGRHTRPRNGIRWDICYAGDDPKDGIWMVWPDFLDESSKFGRSCPAATEPQSSAKSV
jgi:hypothetical protein